jgi:hypothetical protein
MEDTTHHFDPAHDHQTDHATNNSDTRHDAVKRGRDEVAAVINSVPVPPCSCCVQALVAAVALQAVGLPARIGLGGLIYRCGPKETDLVCYTNEHGYGSDTCAAPLPANATLYGHAFVLSGDLLIDLTLNDLKNDHSFLKALHPDEFMQEWVFDPPAYYWGPAESIRHRGKITRLPDIGQAMITDYVGEKAPWELISHEERAYIKYVLREIEQDIRELKRRYQAGDLAL